MDIHTRVTLPDVLRDVSNPGLLELAVCLGPQVRFQHFVLKGSQSPREDCRRINTQIMIKTGLPKEQYITYHVPKNASAALAFDTISQISSIADSEKVHRLQIGTVAPIVLIGALPVPILLQAAEPNLAMYFVN